MPMVCLNQGKLIVQPHFVLDWIITSSRRSTQAAAVRRAAILATSPLFKIPFYFAATTSSSGTELWKSDGTVSGTVMVKDIVSGTGSSSPFYFRAVGNIVYFRACDTNGCELWKSDGTFLGTVMVKDINSGSVGSNPNSLTAVGNTLFFLADDGTNGRELWKSDGTASGTVMVKDINSGSSSNPSYLTAVGNTLYFQADDGTNGL